MTFALFLTALAGCAGPPEEGRPLRAPELVLLDPSIRLDVRYATAKNFTGRPLYSKARVYLQRPAAEALVRVQHALAPSGFGLVVFDGYRPWSVTMALWDATSEDKKEFVADPRKGSRHNRGCAVDLSLVELATGRPAPMPSDFDDMTERAHVDFMGAPEEARANRDLLRKAMEAEGFSVYPAEWWHYDWRDWREYPILDKSFEELGP